MSSTFLQLEIEDILLGTSSAATNDTLVSIPEEHPCRSDSCSVTSVPGVSRSLHLGSRVMRFLAAWSFTDAELM